MAAVLDGTGRPVVLALDPKDNLWAALDGRWIRVTDRPVHGPPAVARAGDGVVVCVSLGPEQMLVHELGPGEAEFREQVVRDGYRPATAIEDQIAVPDGSLAVLYREGERLSVLRSDGAGAESVTAIVRPRAAVLGVSGSGGLEVLAVDGDTGFLVATEQSPGGWTPPVPVSCPVPVDDLSVLDHREGRTIAVAGSQGVWVMTTGGPWTPLDDARPAERVVLRPTRGWRMQLAALVGGRVACWAEDHAKRWVPQD